MKKIKQLRHLHLMRTLLCCTLATFLFLACAGKKNDKKHVASGYNLDRPMEIKLPTELDEISGLAFVAEDTSLLAIVDERGILYKIHLNDVNKIERWRFGKNGDYEEVLLIKDDIWVLRSDGKLFNPHIYDADSAVTEVYDFPDKGNEFEAMYYDSQVNSIILICKDCESDKKKYLSSYSFSLDSFAFQERDLHIDAKEIAEQMGEKKIKFKPSASTLNPFTGRIWIISAINDIIVTVNRDGAIDQVYPFDNGLYKQPEGIAFAPWGTLYISNEAAGEGVANILVFKKLTP